MGIPLFKAPEVTLLCSHDENLCVREMRFFWSVSVCLRGRERLEELEMLLENAWGIWGNMFRRLIIGYDEINV